MAGRISRMLADFIWWHLATLADFFLDMEFEIAKLWPQVRQNFIDLVWIFRKTCWVNENTSPYRLLLFKTGDYGITLRGGSLILHPVFFKDILIHLLAKQSNAHAGFRARYLS
jgi:hypothetical protein